MSSHRGLLAHRRDRFNGLCWTVVVAVVFVVLGLGLGLMRPAAALARATPQLKTVTPSVSVSPTTGAPGTGLTVSGSGWTAGDEIFVQIGSSSFDNDVACVLIADANGHILGNKPGNGCAVPQVPNGSEPLVAIDEQSESTVASGSFKVTAGFTLTPTNGAAGGPTSPGTTVSATGLGFAASSTISKFKFDGTSLTTTPSSVATGTNGSATGAVTFTVPATATAGLHTVTATDGSGDVGTQTIMVYAPTVTLSPTSGAPGASLTVSGSGWPVGDAIFIQIGSASFDTDVVCALTADSDGDIVGNRPGSNCQVPQVPNGSETLIGIDDQREGVVSRSTFTVTAGFSMTPSGGTAGSPTTPGSTVTATGLGFAANSTISKFKFDGTALKTSPTSAATGTNGTANPVTFTVPATATAGVHHVTATDAKGNVGTQTIIVYAGTVSVTPTSRAPGTGLTVSGSGWPAGDAIFVQIGSTSFDTDVVCALTADSNGNIIGNRPQNGCQVPQVPNGSEPLVGIDDQSQGIVSHSSFTVTAGFTLTPSGGAAGSASSPGSTVSATGLGFAANSTISKFKFDGATVKTSPTSVPTGTNGSATSAVTFTVPATATAGLHTLTATDAKGKVGTQTIMIYAPTLTVAPSSGAPGAPLTIQGSGWPAGDSIFIQIGSSSFDADVACALTADSNGSIAGNKPENNCVVPSGVPTGSEPLVAIDDQSQGIVVRSTFNVS